jgi:hypothetical protein
MESADHIVTSSAVGCPAVTAPYALNENMGRHPNAIPSNGSLEATALTVTITDPIH